MPAQYVSIDTETTGTDPAWCQVLELALVAETDWVTPVEELPTLHLLLEHGQIRGQAVGLAMNARLLAELAKPPAERSISTAGSGGVGPLVRDFFNRHFGPCERVTAAGKNAGTFDLRFLERLPDWPADRLRHRVLDPGVLWFDPASDRHLPDTAECLRRAGLAPDGRHRALDDARAVVKMVRRAFARDRFPAAA